MSILGKIECVNKSQASAGMSSKIIDLWKMNCRLAPVMTWGSLLTMNRFRLKRWRHTLQPTRIINVTIRRPSIGTISLREFGSDPYTLQEVIIQNVYGSVLSRIQESKTIVDLGANIGLASRLFASCAPSARIMALEPNPGNYHMLRLNLRDLIKQHRAKTLCAAVWSRTVPLHGCPNEHDPALTDQFRVAPACGSTPAAEAIVGMSMQDVLSEAGFSEVDFLKVDIEGSEAELFSGDLQWLKRVNTIAVEFHEDSRTCSDFDALMACFNFSIVADGKHTVVAVRQSRCART